MYIGKDEKQQQIYRRKTTGEIKMHTDHRMMRFLIKYKLQAG